MPFCVQWKGKIPAGKTYEHPIIQLDILPTAVAAAGGKVDPAWKLDGVDLLPYLTGKNTGKPHETLYWRFGEQWAIRHGDWKLVVGNEPPVPRRRRSRGAVQPRGRHRREARTWPRQQPEKVKELQGLYDAWNAEQKDPLWRPNPAAKKAKQAKKAAKAAKAAKP